jgi:hypothetical protein
MADAIHTNDANYVGVDDQYKNYAGVGRQPLTSADDGMTDRVKALETYRALGVPWLGYNYQFSHPASAQTIIDERVEVDRNVRTAAGLTAQDVIDEHA